MQISKDQKKALFNLSRYPEWKVFTSLLEGEIKLMLNIDDIDEDKIDEILSETKGRKSSAKRIRSFIELVDKIDLIDRTKDNTYE